MLANWRPRKTRECSGSYRWFIKKGMHITSLKITITKKVESVGKDVERLEASGIADGM